MFTGKVEIKLEEIKTHFVFQALVIKKFLLQMSVQAQSPPPYYQTKAEHNKNRN